MDPFTDGEMAERYAAAIWEWLSQKRTMAVCARGLHSMGWSVVCIPFSDGVSSTKKSKDKCPVRPASLLAANSCVNFSMAILSEEDRGRAV